MKPGFWIETGLPSSYFVFLFGALLVIAVIAKPSYWYYLALMPLMTIVFILSRFLSLRRRCCPTKS